MYHKVKGPQERTERRISAATSLAMCARTVLLQIGTTLLLASLRGGLCFIPVLLILAPLLGVTGLQLAQPCADVLTGLLSLPFALRFFRDLPRANILTAADGKAA